MCAKLHSVCELTHCVQITQGFPFAFNMKKIPLTRNFYTHAVAGVADKY